MTARTATVVTRALVQGEIIRVHSSGRGRFLLPLAAECSPAVPDLLVPRCEHDEDEEALYGVGDGEYVLEGNSSVRQCQVAKNPAQPCNVK